MTQAAWVVHGTRNSRYRCRRCLDANAAYMRDYRAKDAVRRRKDSWWKHTRVEALDRLVAEYPERFAEILAEVRMETPGEWWPA